MHLISSRYFLLLCVGLSFFLQRTCPVEALTKLPLTQAIQRRNIGPQQLQPWFPNIAAVYVGMAPDSQDNKIQRHTLTQPGHNTGWDAWRPPQFPRWWLASNNVPIAGLGASNPVAPFPNSRSIQFFAHEPVGSVAFVRPAVHTGVVVGTSLPNVLASGSTRIKLAQEPDAEASPGNSTTSGAVSKSTGAGVAPIQDPNNITVWVPCWRGVKNCGNVNLSNEELKRENGLFALVAYGSGLMSALVYGVTLLVNHNRTQRSFGRLLNGKLRHDHFATREERVRKKRQRMDPESADFVAKGNVYRVLALLHPGIVGWLQWGSWFLQALACLCMQVNLPLFLLRSVLGEWIIMGTKSPYTYLANAFSLLTQLSIFISMCYLFQGRVCDEMTAEAEANYYILSHGRSREDNLTPANTDRSSVSGVASNADAVNTLDEFIDDSESSDEEPVRVPAVPDKLILFNKYFWVLLSQMVNTFMYVVVQCIFIVRIATFTSGILEVTLVAVSLYFVMDLEYHVMKSNPILTTSFSKEILRQTEQRPYKPKWILVLSGFTIGASSFLAPLGIWVLIFVGWRNQREGVEIGGPYP